MSTQPPSIRTVLVITGHICTGKSALARNLVESFGYARLKTSDILRDVAVQRGIQPDRLSLQRLGDTLDQETDHSWILQKAKKEYRRAGSDVPLVVDNVRTWKQLETFRSERGLAVVHAHLWAPTNTLKERFHSKRKELSAEEKAYEEVDIIKDERYIAAFKSDADVRINTLRTDAPETLVRVAARIGLFPSTKKKTVDVIVGGQYGSEGKGHVAGYLARSYDVLLRVGGPSAGHTVLSHTGIYTYVHLP